jgi:uncharacterized membrane protein YfcA
MSPSSMPTITTIVVDVGKVLLTDSWGPTMRQRAVERFGFDFTASICAGFIVGALVGAKFATELSNAALEKVFAVALLLIGAKMLFTP